MHTTFDWWTMQALSLLNEKVSSVYTISYPHHNVIRDLTLVIGLDLSDTSMLYYAIANLYSYNLFNCKTEVTRYSSSSYIYMRLPDCTMAPFFLYSFATARSMRSFFIFWSCAESYNNSIGMSWRCRTFAFDRIFCDYFHGLVDANLSYVVYLNIRLDSTTRYMDRLMLSTLGVPFTNTISQQ